MKPTKTSTMYATAARGTEEVVAAELLRLGFAGVKKGHGGVAFAAADLAAGMRACLHLRAALRVLWPLATFPAVDADAVYEGAMGVPWEDWLTPRSTFLVAATTRAAPPLAHAPILGMRIKDAIADRLRDKRGSRPDVDKDDPDVRVYAHVEAAARSKGGIPAVTVGLDVSGDSLHARGYRVAPTKAPLRESMAAALVALSGWDAASGRPFVDPMCGSGTIAIEAALAACRVAPGRAARQQRFGFERWPSFGDAERAAWRDLCEQADAAVLERAPVPIVAADFDADALAAAQKNAAAAAAPVLRSIEFRRADARELAASEPPAVIVANPPYGERIGGGSGLEGFWRAIGQKWKLLHGHTAFLLVPDGPAASWLGMRPSWSKPLMNGPLEVAFNRYELGRTPAANLPPGKPRR
jgi:putative N6-adenine-specific DNA methylase